MTQINCYVNFDGYCREAMTFYKECLGGELELMTIGNSPMAANCAPDMQNSIMHGTLMNDGTMLLLGSDMNGPIEITKGNQVSMFVSFDNEADITNVFSKFSEDGKIIDPLETKFWGGMFGVIIDRFGLRWSFSYYKNLQQ